MREVLQGKLERASTRLNAKIDRLQSWFHRDDGGGSAGAPDAAAGASSGGQAAREKSTLQLGDHSLVK